MLAGVVKEGDGKGDGEEGKHTQSLIGSSSATGTETIVPRSPREGVRG